MDEARRIERRIGKIKQALAELGDMRPGSISVQTRAWGGRYHQLSYTHMGKGRTEYVPPERLREVKRQLANHKKFKDLFRFECRCIDLVSGDLPETRP